MLLAAANAYCDKIVDVLLLSRLSSLVAWLDDLYCYCTLPPLPVFYNWRAEDMAVAFAVFCAGF